MKEKELRDEFAMAALVKYLEQTRERMVAKSS